MDISNRDKILLREDILYIQMLMYRLKLDELQMILKSLSMNRLGSKLFLQKKILNILNGPRSTLTQNLEEKILKTNLLKQKQLQEPKIKQMEKIQNLLRKYQYNTILFIENMGFTHDLPFFKTIHSLSNTIYCQGYIFSTFKLTELHRKIKNIQKYIKESWDSNRKEYKIQIILRLEQVGQTSIADGRLPASIKVSVNNYNCKLPELIISETDDTPSWRLNIPIDITNQINFNKDEVNNLKIEWSNDPNTYIAGIFLSKKLTAEDLFQELKKKCLLSSDVTKEFIKNSLQNNDDISVGSYSVTLKDPLTTQRMITPARGKECKHLQCFDAIQFLRMNEQKETWACPICKEQVTFENIKIDEFFYRILQSSNLSKGCETVFLFNDGTWAESKTKIYTSLNNKEITLIDSDEDNN